MLTSFLRTPIILPEIVGFLKFVSKIQQLPWKRSWKKQLLHNFALQFTSYLSTALSKVLHHLKTVKNAKKLSEFGENDSRCLSNFLQIHIFWNFDHISRICNQINYSNIWFAKVIIILIMTAQVLFLMFFSKKTHTLMLLSIRGWSNSFAADVLCMEKWWLIFTRKMFANHLWRSAILKAHSQVWDNFRQQKPL